MRPTFAMTIALLLAGPIGCHTTGGAPASPEPAPAVSSPSSKGASKTFTDVAAGIRFDFLADWQIDPARNGDTQVFRAHAGSSPATLTLDVPSLPFHLPGMITPSAVANGYINDAKKRISGAVVQENSSIQVANASARRVKIVGQIIGVTTTDIAALIVHNDAVYVLSSDGSGNGVAPAQQALNEAVKSLRWIR